MLATTEILTLAQVFSIYKDELPKIRLLNVASRSKLPLKNLKSLYDTLLKET